MTGNNYRCPHCNNIFPLSNKTLHDLRCPGLNHSYPNNNVRPINSNDNNNNMNQTNNFFINNMNNGINGSNNANIIIATNTSSQPNPDGTRTDIKIETFQNGTQRITQTKYDQFNNKISSSEQYRQNNNNNNFNNNNFNNNNFNNNNFNNNNLNNNLQRTIDQFGNVRETETEVLPNGTIKTTTITRDRNGNFLGQSINISRPGGNNFNNNMQMNNNINNNNMMMNNMNNNFNNNNMMMNEMMNNINNMSMNMNNMFNNMSNMFNNMFNGMGMNMNNMFNNIGMNMTNMNNINMNNMVDNMGMNMNDVNNMNDDMNNGVSPDILNNLMVTKLDDASKLSDDKKNCVICLEDFKNGDEVIYLPCLHVFNKDCLLEWFKGHDYCPICKFKLTYENMNQQ